MGLMERLERNSVGHKSGSKSCTPIRTAPRMLRADSEVCSQADGSQVDNLGSAKDDQAFSE